MSRELEYFKEFLDNPGAYKVREFYIWIREWVEYVTSHKDEFNYLEDEEWREIKERVLEALEIKEDLKDEFEEIEEKLDSVNELETDAEKIEVYNEWLAFLKRNQAEYDFADADIAEAEAMLGKLIIDVLDYEILEERLKGSKMRHQKALNELDESIFGHYQRTGKRPILTALPNRKRIKGN